MDEDKPKKHGLIKEIDWDVIDGILTFGASLIDCADYAKVSVQTIQRGVLREKGMGFEDYRNLKLSRMRVNLRKKMWDKAIKDGSVAMLIWLSKNELGMTDRCQVVSELTTKLSQNEITDKKEQLRELMKLLEALGMIDMGVKNNNGIQQRPIDTVVSRVEDMERGPDRGIESSDPEV